MPVLPILGIIFVTLKLCAVIDWSWFWVLAPFWLMPFVWIAMLLGFLGFVGMTNKRL